MISDKSLVRLSFCISIIGIIMLFLIIPPANTIEIKNINEKLNGRTVTVNGTIKSYSLNNGNVFMVIENMNSSIKIVIFENSAKKIPIMRDIKNNDNVIITGKIDTYKGELEIIAENVEFL